MLSNWNANWGKTIERNKIKDMLRRHEGEVTQHGRHIVYKCTAGKNTIGYGRNLDDRGLSQFEADILLDHDYQACIMDLERIFGREWLAWIPDTTLAVCVDMRFALGGAGFRKFKKFIAAAKDNKLFAMEKELRDSKWYRGEGKDRIEDLFRIMYGGFDHGRG